MPPSARVRVGAPHLDAPESDRASPREGELEDRLLAWLALLLLELRGRLLAQLARGLAVVLLERGVELLGHGHDVSLAAGGPARGQR